MCTEKNVLIKKLYKCLLKESKILAVANLHVLTRESVVFHSPVKKRFQSKWSVKMMTIGL